MVQFTDVRVTLSTDQLRVNPGEEVKLTVTVHNNGPEIDCFRLEVNGLDPEWWEFDVPGKPLLPHDEPCRDCIFQSVLTINPPPNSSALAKPYPLEIKTTREQNPGQATVIPVSFEVLPFYSFECNLETDEATSVHGDYILEFSNTGNKELNFAVTGDDRKQLYRVLFLQDGLWEERVNVCVHPGEGKKLSLPVSVQPVEQPFKGKPRVYDFTIIATPQERGLARKEVGGRLNALSRLAGWRRRVSSFLRRSLGTPRVPSLRMPTWAWIICVAALMAVIVVAILFTLVGRPPTYVLEFQLNSGEAMSYALPLPDATTVRIKGNAQWLDSRGDLQVGLVRPDGSSSTLFALPPSAPSIAFTMDEEVADQGSTGWEIRLLNSSTTQPARGTLSISLSSLK